MAKAKGKRPTTLADLTEPFGKSILISRPNAVGRGEARQTASGVYLPADTRTEYGRICRVRKVGPDVEGIKPGDTVIVAEFSGLPIFTEADEDETYIVAQGDIIAKVEDRYWREVARA